MSAVDSRKDMLSVTPPKSKNSSPLSGSPTVSEIMRSHAQLFGKEPLVSPLHSTSCESDVECDEIGPIDSASQQGVADTESVCTDKTENSHNVDSLSSGMSQEMNQSRDCHQRTDTVDIIFFGKRSSLSSPHRNSNVNQCNEMRESDSSLSPTVSQIMRNPGKIKSLHRSVDEGTSVHSQTKGRSKRNTVTVNRGFKKLRSLTSGVLTPITSELSNLHIKDTPRKQQKSNNTDIISIGEDVTKNRHEISPLIQEHLNGKSHPGSRKSKVVRNIFGASGTRTRRLSNGEILNVVFF